ncbi:MAG: hypothetical protein M0042_06755 [Nitrospiraceae bacterium]|nr:hypothetical protein [Nitrospiraceae bacterium]
MKNVFIVLLSGILLALAGCGSTTFLVGKDGYYTFFGRKNTDLGKALCTTGELRTILDDAQIPGIAKDGFFRYSCTPEYSRDMVLSIYTFMTPDEKKELMRAFARRGYEVNLVHC